MKWSFVVQQKMKLTFLLVGICVVIFLTNFAERQNNHELNNSFRSIYDDRLIPATDIFYLSEKLYNNRVVLEKFISAEIHNPEKETILRARLETHNMQIDSLIRAFENTYLVDKESTFLAAFKNMAEKYRAIENKAIALYVEGNVQQARAFYELEGNVVFQDMIKHLYELAAIQSNVGRELMKETKVLASGNNMISTLQLALVLIIGLAIQVLITSSKILKTTSKDFRLN